MRLVDADVADKWMRQNNAFIDAAILKAIPTIDAVPVVRCRECVHYREHRTRKYKQLISSCVRMAKNDMEHHVWPDDFCSYGRRKETTDDEIQG